MRIEWRSKTEGDDALVMIEEESNKVLDVRKANPALLVDFLNDMVGLDVGSGQSVVAAEASPQDWGRLVIARAGDGEVLTIDPQLYWEGIAHWFRSRGDDPHKWRSRN